MVGSSSKKHTKVHENDNETVNNDRSQLLQACARETCDATRTIIHRSIHPSSAAYLGPGHGGTSLSREAMTSLSP